MVSIFAEQDCISIMDYSYPKLNMFTVGGGCAKLFLNAEGSDCQALLLESQSLFFMPSKHSHGFLQSTYERHFNFWSSWPKVVDL